MKAQATTWTQLMQATTPARAAARPPREDRAFSLADPSDDGRATRRIDAKAPAARSNDTQAPSRREEAAPRTPDDGGRAAARDAATTATAEDSVRERTIKDNAAKDSAAKDSAAKDSPAKDSVAKDKTAIEKAGDDTPGSGDRPGETTASQAAKGDQPAAQAETKGDAVPATATAAGLQAQSSLASRADGRPPAPDAGSASPAAAVGSAGASSTGAQQAAAGAPRSQAATVGAPAVPVSESDAHGAATGASAEAEAFASLVADTIGGAGASADGSATTLVALQPAEGAKAGPAAATAPAQTVRAAEGATAPTSLGAVPIEIGLRALAGSSRFDIRLDPAELGRIDVRLDIDKEHGAVKAHLTVERPETLALLQRDTGRLEEALTQAGLTTADGAINVSLRDPSQGGRQDESTSRDGAPSFGTSGPSGETDTREQALAAAPRVRLRPTGIDIRI